uniref:Uncharacterized protein n=1 Tax=Anguilla anguilla TaxID=7936 RepID=A0A0E9REH6_ANGAN
MVGEEVTHYIAVWLVVEGPAAPFPLVSLDLAHRMLYLTVR